MVRDVLEGPDPKLPFELRSAPKFFTAIADALEWCMEKEGVQAVYHYPR